VIKASGESGGDWPVRINVLLCLFTLTFILESFKCLFRMIVMVMVVVAILANNVDKIIKTITIVISANQSIYSIPFFKTKNDVLQRSLDFFAHRNIVDLQ
jgi:hypothetical protein